MNPSSSSSKSSKVQHRRRPRIPPQPGTVGFAMMRQQQKTTASRIGPGGIRYYNYRNPDPANASTANSSSNTSPIPSQEEEEQALLLSKIHGARSKFVQQQGDKAAQEMARQSVGLVHLDQFQKIREQVQAAVTEENEKVAEDMTSEAAASRSQLGKRKPSTCMLSFDDEEGEEEYVSAGKLNDLNQKSQKSTVQSPKKKGFRDPSVDTSFLSTPWTTSTDEGADGSQQYGLKDKHQIAMEMEKKDGKLRMEPLNLSCLYVGKTAMPAILHCQRGNTIAQCLELAKQEFKKHIGSVPTEDLLFVKDDRILPHNVTFHELILSKARGRTGPLFTADVPVTQKAVTDAQVAQVLEKSYYEKHCHEMPMVRWDVYDASKDYGKYLSTK